MNEHSRPKRFHGFSGHRFQNAARARTTGFRLLPQTSGAKRFSMETKGFFHSARELMICLDWLRLFQTIVSADYLPATRKPFSRELYNAVATRFTGLDLVPLSPARRLFVQGPASNKLAVRPDLRLSSTAPKPHRLPISPWRTHSWTKKIAKCALR